MRKALKDKWVAALEGNRFDQGRGDLKRKYYPTHCGGKPRYCCLGVLCAISNSGKFYRVKNMHYANRFYNYRIYQKNMPGVSLEGRTQGGMLSDDGLKFFGISRRVVSVLVRMNDLGKSFKEIAAYIRRHVRAT